MLKLNEANETIQKMNIKIKSSFYDLKDINSPILKCVNIFLEAIGEGGLKLTAKGSLSTKLVEELAKAQPLASEALHLKNTKRFLEIEQPAAMRTRLLLDESKLIEEKSNKLFITQKGSDFLNLSKPEQFTYLFYSYLIIDLACFDKHQSVLFINDISAKMLQLVRDEPKDARGSDEYCLFLINQYTQISNLVDENIHQEPDTSGSLYELFIQIVDLRLFENFFASMGFVKDIKNGDGEPYSYEKTLLLDKFLESVNGAENLKILDASIVTDLSQKIKDKKLDIDLFNDLCFMLTNYTSVPVPPPVVMANSIVKQKKLTGATKDAELIFYTELCEYIDITMKNFTELYKTGSKEDLGMKYKSLVNGLYLLLPKTTSYNLFMKSQPMPYFLSGMIKTKYELALADEKFYEQCVQKLNGNLAESISAFMSSISEMQKKSKKIKKVKPQIAEVTKGAIHNYILVLLQLRSHGEDALL